MEEMDAAVVASASCGQERGLPGRECNGFDGCVKSENVLSFTGKNGQYFFLVRRVYTAGARTLVSHSYSWTMLVVSWRSWL
jgi:hypothetical protein